MTYLKLLTESSKWVEQPLEKLHYTMLNTSSEIVGFISPKKKMFMLLPENDIESSGQTHIRFKLFPPKDKSYNICFHSHPRMLCTDYLNVPDALSTLINAKPPLSMKYAVILSLKNVSIFQVTPLGKKIPLEKLDAIKEDFLRNGDRTSSDSFFDKYREMFKDTIKPRYCVPYEELGKLK